MITFFPFLLLTSLAPSSRGFAIPSIRMPWSTQAANPEIERYAKAQVNTELRVRLDIGGRDTAPSRLAIDGIVLELRGRDDELDRRTAARRGVPLPGADGPNPDLSSGPRSLNVVCGGSFVGPAGEQTVDLGGDEARWEIIWRENAPAGALVLAFDVPGEVRRNEATLSKGRVYITLPLWTESGLKRGRVIKTKVEEKAAEYQQEKEEEIERIKSTSNPLMKALHYRKAYAAAEKYFLSGVHRMNEIPNADDVLKINGDLLLSKSGTVWTKTLGFGGSDRVLLGVAEATVPNQIQM